MSNPFAKFMNLLPKQEKSIGKIIRIETDGTVEVANVAGTSSTIVKGGTDSYEVNDYVFIIDGIINSKLPAAQVILEEQMDIKEN